jgi:hypothetical protein
MGSVCKKRKILKECSIQSSLTPYISDQVHFLDFDKNIIHIYSLDEKKYRSLPIKEDIGKCCTTLQVGKKILITGGKFMSRIQKSPSKGERPFLSPLKALESDKLESPAPGSALPLEQEAEGDPENPNLDSQAASLPRFSASEGGFLKLFCEYNESSNRLMQKIPMLKGKSDHAFIAISENTLYTLGGLGKRGITDFCERYSAVDRKWVPVAKLTQPRKWLTACSFNRNFIYTFGGVRDTDFVDSASSPIVEKLNVEYDTHGWVSIAIQGKGWTPLRNAGAFQISKNEILIFGGDYPEKNKTFILNVDTKAMKPGKKMKKEEVFFCKTPALYFDSMYIIGHMYCDIHEFEISKKNWNNLIHFATWSAKK